MVSRRRLYIPKLKAQIMSKGENGGESRLNRTDLTMLVTFILFIIFAGIAIISPPQSLMPPRTYLEIGFLALVMVTFSTTYFELLERTKNEKIKASSKLALKFFAWGFSLTFSGLVTTFFAMFVNIMDINNNFRDVISFYVQISLNLLIGGITLVGASLPILYSLLGQSESETTSTPPSSEESGGGQQSK